MDGIAGHNRDRFGATDVVRRYAATEGLTPAEELLFDRHVPPGARTLDLGMGTGRTTPWLRARSSSYQGLDIVPQMVEEAMRLHPDADLRVGDAADLSPIADHDLDVVVFSYNGIDYLADGARSRALTEVVRVLRPGGTFIFSTHAPRSLLIRPSDLPGRALRRWATSGYVAGRRTVRYLPTRAFWRGEGWILDPASGGLHTHVASPRHVAAELGRHQLEIIDRLGGDHPQPGRALITPWWYYVATSPG